MDPAPALIPAHQMNLLRILAAMAWSDGYLAPEEVNLILVRFSHLFSADLAQQQVLKQELEDYLEQEVPLEELIPQLASAEERELVQQLSHEAIHSTPQIRGTEISEATVAAYRRLVQIVSALPLKVEPIADLDDMG